MCGISGICRLDHKDIIDLNVLREMTDLVKHRGPDDEGYILIDPVTGQAESYSGKESTSGIRGKYPLLDKAQSQALGMGFRRLSILDLSESGHQPMHDPELNLTITFNGEIYNHPELRQELIGLGYRFLSSSDTEVILKAYACWGESCVSHFIGMWAFALWDAPLQKLFLSRDRYGIKPLYYALHEDTLYWGSELKQFMPTPVDKSLNTPMLWRSMKINSLLVYDDQTFWDKIKMLKPSHNLSISHGNLTLSKYYELDLESFESSTLCLDDATQKYREMFLDSLKLHLRSDVEIGASLSGGMDSSAIVCSARNLSGAGMQTFSSFYTDDPAMDEREWIKLIVNQTDSRPQFISPTADDAAAWLETVTYYNDIPTRTGYASQWAVNKLAHASGIKVMLSGQGSDELFAGYRHAAYRYFADQLRSFNTAKLASELPAYFNGNRLSDNLSRSLKILLSTALPESGLYKLEFERLRFEPFNRPFIATAKAQADAPILDKIRDIPVSRLANFLYNMLNTTSIQTLLHLEDRMSGANSVESRVPFLDHRLVDFSFSLPSSFKIKPPMHKYIHRQAMKEIVPKEIYARKDKGIFSSPFYSIWMKGALRPLFEETIASTAFRQRGIWNLPLIHNQWKSYLRGNSKQAEMLFNVIALETWFRIYQDKPLQGWYQ